MLDILHAVHTHNLGFPSWYTDRAGRHLMRGLLRKEPDSRIGAGVGGFDSLKNHEFFTVDEADGLFALLLMRRLAAPYTPRVQSDSEESGEELVPVSSVVFLLQVLPRSSVARVTV